MHFNKESGLPRNPNREVRPLLTAQCCIARVLVECRPARRHHCRPRYERLMRPRWFVSQSAGYWALVGAVTVKDVVDFSWWTSKEKVACDFDLVFNRHLHFS